MAAVGVAVACKFELQRNVGDAPGSREIIILCSSPPSSLPISTTSTHKIARRMARVVPRRVHTATSMIRNGGGVVDLNWTDGYIHPE